MSDIANNCCAFLQKRFSFAPVQQQEVAFTIESMANKEVCKAWVMIAQDAVTGIKQRAIAMHDFGLKNETQFVPSIVNNLFSQMDNTIIIEYPLAKSHFVSTRQMSISPVVVLYSNKIHVPYDSIKIAFSSANMLVEIINENEMYNSLFISYGGIDKSAAAKINAYLKRKGIKTWFFPDDALPGQKLHRAMHNGINNHDRVLLICSEKSLSRPGVLNEIERVLEREGREGGSEILIPITLDDYVFSNWAPQRTDIAQQIRSRVIAKINTEQLESTHIHKQLEKLLIALSKKN